MAEAGRRILIVQEDSIEAGLIGFHLKQAGMTALVVTSTQEAWDAIGWGPPEVIVAELKTENIDGLEVVGGLVGKEVAAFLISDGIPTPEEELEALDRGVREIFTKPIDHRIMAERIATATLRIMDEGDASETAPIRGWLQDHSMTSLLDMCRRLKLNARLSVELPNSESGHLVIREGRVIDGVRGDRAGREAVFTVMTLAAGRFTLTPVVAEDPLLEGVDRVRMDLASLLEAAVRPRDRSGSPHTSPRTSRRPRTKTGLTTLDDIVVIEDNNDPATVISAPPARMPSVTTEPSAGPSTTTDAISSHVAMNLRLDRPDPDAYAPTYVSERPLAVANTMQQSSPRSDVLRTLSKGEENLLFPDDDMVDSLPSGPVEEESPETANELVGGIEPADPYSSTADAFSAITNEDLAGLEDDDEEEQEQDSSPFTENDIITGIPSADPFTSTEEAFKALTIDDIELAKRTGSFGVTAPEDEEEEEEEEQISGPFTENEIVTDVPVANPFTSTEEAFKALTTDDIELAERTGSFSVTSPEDEEEEEDANLAIDEPMDDDPMNRRHSQGPPTRQTKSDYGELRPKSGLLQQSEIDELDEGFFDDDEDEDEDDEEETFSNYDETPEEDYEPMPSVPSLAPAVQQTSDVLSPSAPMDHEPGPETLGVIQAAMPGYGRGRWIGRAVLIALSLAFLALGGLVVSKLMGRSADTSPAAGLNTEVLDEKSPAPSVAEEPIPEKSPEERAKDHYGLGNLAAQADKLGDAMDHYRAALKINPDHAGALAGLSAALIKGKQYADARPMLEELLRVAPLEGAAHLTLGLIAHKLDDPQARGTALNAFMKLVPDSPHRTKLLELLTGGETQSDDGTVGVE